MIARYLRTKATGRNVLFLFALTAVLGASFGFVFMPAYQAVSGGADPFDIQFPLTAQMIGVQLGLLTRQSIDAYRNFMIADTLFPPLNGMLLVLLWAWLLGRLKSPRLDGVYDAGFWVVPLLPAVADLAENVLFYRIIAAAPAAMPETIDTVVAVHGTKLRLLSMVMMLTAVLIVVVLISAIRRRFTS